MRKFTILGLLFFPITTYANVIWPALLLEMQLLSWWWLVFAGLFIEFFFVLKLLKTTPKQAALATLSANIASALLGVILIPLSGLAWGVFPGFLFYFITIDSFHIINWAGTLLYACAVNVVIEGLVYKILFKLNFLFKSKLFFWFMLANAASVGVAVVHFIINPV